MPRERICSLTWVRVPTCSQESPRLLVDMAYQGNDNLPAKTIAVITGYLIGDLIVVLYTFGPWAPVVISGPVSTCIHHALGR